MPRPNTALLTACLAIAAIGCADDPADGSGGDGGGGGGEVEGKPEPIPLPDGFGQEPDRNRIAAGEICERLAIIQCIAEMMCCDDPRRGLRDCLNRQQELCQEQLLADRVSMEKTAGFDPDLAEQAFNDLEAMSRNCDPDITPFETAPDGFGQLFQGSVNPGGNCEPADANMLAMVHAALAACKDPINNACLPSDNMWRCQPRGEQPAAPCFTDNNCVAGLYCDNPDPTTADGKCHNRTANGEACEKDHECVSLACWDDVCTPRNSQTAYCYGR